MHELPRDLVTILRTEARNQRTPPIDYVIAEDGGRMVHTPEPDIAMAELLEEAATALESLSAENERLRKALERVPDQAGHWAYVHCRVHIGSEHEDELSEFVTQKVRSFVDRALAQEQGR